MSSPLHIVSDVVGLKIPAVERRVTWRETMNYAAAVGDLNPRYFDDTRPGGIVAPPMFAVATTWPIVTGMQGLLGDAIPPAAMSRLVHASEHLVFHQPLRPGRAFRIGGEVTSLTATRAGALMTLRFDATEADGTAVFTERVGAMFRGASCDPSALPGESPASAPLPDEGREPDWEAEIPVSREAAHVYDGCTNIVFPIHTSRAFALGAGLPDIILQGTATLATAARELVDRDGEGDPGRLQELACRFTGMVIPGSTIRIRAWKKDAQIALFEVLGGGKKISQGMARLESVFGA